MTLKIKIHNVGHGQAIHLFTPNAQSVVIDLGCSEEFSPLRWLSSQTKTIDNLIVTHPHGDHIDEILELDKLGFYVRQLWRPKWLPEQDVRNANQSNYSDKLDCYFEMSNNKFIHDILDSDLVGNPSVSGGVSIVKFASKDCETSNINNHSAVVIIEYCGIKVIVPGDNELESWKMLTGKSAFINEIKNTDLFIASHHGRESGYYSKLFEKINPKLCIISDGRVQNTDATSRYSHHATGWVVHSRKVDDSISRNCLTTRTDGYIDIEIGRNENTFLSVTRD